MKTRAETRECRLEKALVKAFAHKTKKRRLMRLLETKKGREKFIDSLAHSFIPDERFVQEIPTRLQNGDGVLQLLKSKHAKNNCYVISANWKIDGKTLPLAEALFQIVGFGAYDGFGTLVSCIPGKLAYYEGEEPHDRYILERRRIAE